MAKKADQTASFMVRFNQIIFEDKGESKVQWRGKVSHVQGGDDQSFSDFNDAVKFIQAFPREKRIRSFLIMTNLLNLLRRKRS